MGQFMDLYKSGAIGPIKPMTLFSATQVTDAFRYMQRGQHIGKIVITMPEKASDVEATAVRRNLELRADKSYLLVGGLGGLGRAISIWLVEHGARHLIFISRTAGESPEHQEFFKDLEEQECSVQVFCGSATNIEHVKQAVANAKYPLAGVLHMSMVLRVWPIVFEYHSDYFTNRMRRTKTCCSSPTKRGPQQSSPRSK